MTKRYRAAMGAALLSTILAACHPVGPGGTAPTPGSVPAAIPVGASTRTLAVDGVTRTYHLYRPATSGSTPAPTGPAPLVVMLHGGFGTGSQAESAYGWDGAADRAGFVVAYPDGLDRAWAVGGGCCGKPGTASPDGSADVSFLVDMVHAIEAATPIDPARVYATGISNGGLMAYRLACDTDLFAAIGPDSATLLGSCPHPARVSVIHVHGTADHNIPYDGGVGDGYASIDGPAVPALVATWRATDGCTPPQVATQTTTGGAVTTSLAQCPQGRAVELVTLAGAGHQWPGSAPKPVLERLLGLDPPSTALDATDTIWTFFAAHPKPAA